MIGGCSKDGARLFSVVPGDRTRCCGHKKETHKGLPEHHQEALLYSAGDRELAHIAQHGCGSSLHGAWET